MVNGFATETAVKKYEDWVSLKKWMKDENYKDRRTIHRKYTQTGTAGAVEVQDPSGETVAQIGKATVTMTVVGAGAEKLADNGKIITAVFISALGVETTHTAVIAGTFHDTAMAFTPAATTKYALKSLSISAASANDLTVISGGVTYGTITAAATSATQAQLFGVGSITVHQKTDQHGTDDEKDCYGKYRTPWGAKKYFICTTGATNTATDIMIPVEATWDEATDTYTAVTGNIQVKDFYRLIEFKFEQAAADELLICDITGGAAVYGVIPATSSRAVFTRYMAPYSTLNEHAFLGSLKVWNTTAAIVLALTYTKKGEVTATIENFPIPASTVLEHIDICEELEPLSEVSMTIIGNTAVCNINMQIIEGVKA